MPGPLIDCYVLAPARSAQLAELFLERFVPERSPSFEADDPAQVLGVSPDTSPEAVMAFLVENPTIEYWMYWNNERDALPSNALVAFNDDGSLVFGLAAAYDDEPHVALVTLAAMKRLVGSSCGYTTVEQAPASSRVEFLARASADRL